MKKILASCLTSVALLGSLCFSSPLTQVHAEEIEIDIEQSSPTYVPIELNVQEVPVGYTHTLNVNSSDVINVDIPEDEKFNLESDSRMSASLSEVEKQFSISEASWVTLTGQESGKKYKIELKISNTSNTEDEENVNDDIPAAEETTDNSNDEKREEDGDIVEDTVENDVDDSTTNFASEAPSTNSDFAHIYELKLANTSDYEAKGIELGNDSQHIEIENVSIPVTVTPIEMLKIETTKANLKVGEGFYLNLPEVIKSKIDPEIFNYYLSGEYYHPTGEISEHAFTDYMTLDEQDQWKGIIDSDEIGGKFKLTATMSKEELLNVGAETGLIDPESIAEETTFQFPVEITITADGKGDIIDEEDEINVFLNLTPEYKKLTSRGETYKIDANVEIDEDADPEAKESFEAMKQDGHFKVLFVSNDTNVATVAEDGTVTAVANGSTEILAYVEGYEDELFGISKVDVEIPEKVEEENEDSSSYPKTGDNFMAVSAAILTLGLAALVIAFVSKKQKDVNEEK